MIPKLPKGFSHPMVIGRGSFSSVYRARQSALDRWVAIKILPEKVPEHQQALLKEAQTQAQMSIGCIPAVYDAFAWGQQVCIVMQWIKGVSLHSLLERNPSPLERRLLAAASVEALANLHRLGYAHRDLKPANILISPREGLFLVDFGFSKSILDGERSMSKTMTVKGTPAFMAPELWQPSKDADLLKADLYALGKILRLLNPGLEWEDLIRLFLAEDPSARPPSANSAWMAWQTLLIPETRRDWKSLSGPLAAEQLAGNLLVAAKNLLHAGKDEEAYWLLSECLEEDPDSAEAMRLMEQFPILSRKKTKSRKLLSAVLVIGFTLAVSAGFYFGRQSGHRSMPSIAPEELTAKAFFLPHPKIPRSKNPGRDLKELPKKSNRLSGWLFLNRPNRCDTLLLDGEEIAIGRLQEGFPLTFGDHVLLCHDPMAWDSRKEKFYLLPFQKKILMLAPARQVFGKG